MTLLNDPELLGIPEVQGVSNREVEPQLQDEALSTGNSRLSIATKQHVIWRLHARCAAIPLEEAVVVLLQAFLALAGSSSYLLRFEQTVHG